ncbi:MAG: hypothetical protein FJ384_06110 [Verrucomicrobia bacterium]|nr:hypothetical protein [Verrucomicrobiota bacterium]
MTENPGASGLIELRLGHVGQLFNTMDPSPFHERDLDHDAEEFILSWAREHEHDAVLRLRVVLRQPADEHTAGQVRESVRHYFAYRARMARRELRDLFREGRTSLAIGALFLAATLVLRGLIPAGGWTDIVREGLTICGWVGLWKPIDIHLYRWWPLKAHGDLLARLGDGEVEVVFEA